MEPEVHQVLLRLYQKDPWLHIKYTFQRVIIFGGGGYIPIFGTKIHQIQLINIPKLRFFSETPTH